MSAQLRRLGDVCTPDRQSIRSGERLDLQYVGLESIEANTGRFVNGDLSKTPETPKANSFFFSSRHVLYGKLRPYLNKVAVPEFDGKCSTEIVPLLPRAGLDRSYLAFFLRCPQVVHRICERTAGARMPRADMDFVLSLPISLPSPAEQRRVVDILSRAQGVIRLRCEAQEKVQEIIPALFLEMFGDPAANPRGWPVFSLGELIAGGPQNGLYKPASAYGDGTPILRIDSFYDGCVGDLTQLRRVRLTPWEVEKFRLREGDIVVNRVNSVEYLGKSAVIPRLGEPMVFESNMMRLTLCQELVRPLFLIAFLQTSAAKRRLLSAAKHAINQSSINQRDVTGVPVPVPPLARQDAFAEAVTQTASLSTLSANALGASEGALRSLLSRGFSFQH